MTERPGRRQQKRAATRRALIDAATALVAEHGYANVTVEDICSAANVSRRTFFNYMESKDAAVLGDFPLKFDDATTRRIIETPSGNLANDILRELAVAFADRAETTDTQFNEKIRHRRMGILSREPALDLITRDRFRTMVMFVRGVVIDHFDRYPDDRHLPDLSAEDEARVVVALVRDALLLSAPFDHEPTNSESLYRAWRDSAHWLTRLAKGLSW